VLLIYANRVEEQIVYRSELDRLARHPHTRIVHVLSEPTPGWHGRAGLVDAGLLAEEFAEANLKDWLFLLCGPPPMIKVVENALIDLGAPPEQVVSERFSYD
jgi:NAD(P)H-flavin reductase